jgi:uncharacterized membrane protein YkoI
MLKKLRTRSNIAVVLTGVFLLVSLVAIPGCAGTAANTSPTQAAVLSSEASTAEDNTTGPDLDNVEEQAGDQNEVDEQQPQYTGSITVDDSQYEGMSEADEAAALQDMAAISSAEAEAAAVAANPGTTVVKTELDNENGVVVYSVELSNGMDVKVDAGNGEILYTEQAGSDDAEVDGTETAPEQEALED